VDWIQFPFEVWGRLHSSPDAPLLRLRWMYTDQPFLPVGTGCVVNNRVWNEDEVSELTVGQSPLEESDYVQDDRWHLPAFAFDGHMCHPEWFAVGEPWPVPSTLPPTVYLDGWIPECCVMCCVFVGCSLTPFAGEPASQWKQFATDAKDATADTPFAQSEVGDALGGAGPNVRGAVWSYHPLGANGAGGYEQGAYADADGAMLRVTRDADFGDDNTSAELIDADGWTYNLTVAGVATQLRLRVVGGVGELCGTNLTICPAIMPLVMQWDVGGSIAFGNAQFNATLAPQRVSSAVSTLATRGIRLPPMTSTAGDIRVIFCPTAAPPRTGCLLYPAVGESFTGLAVNAPYTLNMGVGLLLIGFAATPKQWCVIPFPV
jgi:hypothetical protein